MKKDLVTLFQNIKVRTEEPGDLLGTLNRIGTVAQNYFETDLCVIFPMNPVTRTFLREKPTIIGKLDKTASSDFQIPTEQGLAKLVLSEKLLFIEKDKIHEYTSPITEMEQIRSFAAFGLFTERLRIPLAVMYLEYRRDKRFTDRFQTNVKSFIEFASSELQNTWFIRRYRAIAKIGQEINENPEDIEGIFEKIVQHVKGILDIGYYFSLAKYNLHQNTVDLYLVEHGKKISIKKEFPLEASISSWVIENLTSKKIDNIDSEVLPENIQAIHVDGTKSEEKSLMFVPLKIYNRPLGVISVQHPEPGHYDEEDRQILDLLANHISLAINNIRLLDDLQSINQSGQILTQKLEADKDILQEVVEFTHNATQADIVILYPYIEGENQYLSPIYKGTLISEGPLGNAEPDSSTLVHLTNLQQEPVFADDSAEFYTVVGMGNSIESNFWAKEKIKSSAAIPLKVGAEPIGVLFVNFRNKQKFDHAQKSTISALATYASIAIKNSRQYQELHLRRLKELEALRRIDKEISGTLDSNLILNTILELTTQHIKADASEILLLNKKTSALEVRATKGFSVRPENQRLDQYKGIVKSAFERKKAIKINDVREDNKWKDKYIEFSKETNSELAVPLILGQDTIGVMNFESNKRNAYSEDDQRFIETLAGQAVIAIKNAIEHERTQRIARERAALIEIVNRLIIQTDTKEVFLIILEKALEITETSFGTISGCDEGRRKIKNITAKGVKDSWRDKISTFDEGIKGRVAREKRFIKIDNLAENPLKTEYLDVFQGKMESLLAVPIMEGNRIKGIINLESENPYHFEQDDVELVHSLASLCAVALKTVENIQQKQLASVGTITGDISHKMNSPLSLIQKQIEFIEMNCTKELAENTYLANKIAQINSITSDTIKMVQRLIEEAKRSFGNLEREYRLNLHCRKQLPNPKSRKTSN